MNNKKNKNVQNNKNSKGGDPCTTNTITQTNTAWKSTL